MLTRRLVGVLGFPIRNLLAKAIEFSVESVELPLLLLFHRPQFVVVHAPNSSQGSVVVFAAMPYVVEFNSPNDMDFIFPTVLESGRNALQDDKQERRREDSDFDPRWHGLA